MTNPASTDIHPIILDLMQQRAEALVQADLPFFERLLAPDFRYINSSGQLLDRAEYLERLASGTLRFQSQTFDQVDVKTYGDLVLVTCRLHDRAAWQGQPFEASVRALHVYQRQTDGWRWLAGQATETQPS